MNFIKILLGIVAVVFVRRAISCVLRLVSKLCCDFQLEIFVKLLMNVGFVLGYYAYLRDRSRPL